MRPPGDAGSAVLTLLFPATQHPTDKVCSRPVSHSPAGEATAEDEEAEYAWLPAEALKVFHVGDGSGAGDGQTVPDPNLASCIAAAERAVVAEQRAMEAVADGELQSAQWEAKGAGGRAGVVGCGPGPGFVLADHPQTAQ